MVGLGAFYWLYALRPRLPVIRALPYFWRGNLPPAPEWRAFAALVGTLFVTGGAYALQCIKRTRMSWRREMLCVKSS